MSVLGISATVSCRWRRRIDALADGGVVERLVGTGPWTPRKSGLLQRSNSRATVIMRVSLCRMTTSAASLLLGVAGEAWRRRPCTRRRSRSGPRSGRRLEEPRLGVGPVDAVEDAEERTARRAPLRLRRVRSASESVVSDALPLSQRLRELPGGRQQRPAGCKVMGGIVAANCRVAADVNLAGTLCAGRPVRHPFRMTTSFTNRRMHDSCPHRYR